MLFGHPSALAYLAQHAKNEGFVWMIWASKWHLSLQKNSTTSSASRSNRALPVVSRTVYGGRDAGFVAQCPDSGAHLTAEDIIVVEIIGSDDQPVPGESGENSIVTHLASGFPLFPSHRRSWRLDPTPAVAVVVYLC